MRSSANCARNSLTCVPKKFSCSRSFIAASTPRPSVENGTRADGCARRGNFSKRATLHSRFDQQGGDRGKRNSVVAVGGSDPHHHSSRADLALIMATDPYSRPDPALYPGHSLDGPSISAVSLSAIVAGTVAAIALTIALGVIGTGFGLASVSVWPGAGSSPKTFTIGAGLWIIVTQWL